MKKTTGNVLEDIPKRVDKIIVMDKYMTARLGNWRACSLMRFFWATIGGYRSLLTKEKVAIFTRYPEPGKTKIRLIPTLGPQKAADLQRQMTEKTLFWARELRRQRGVEIEIRYTGSGKSRMQHWLGQDVGYSAQGRGDLGKRMARIFRKSFRCGFQRVVIVGIDCPELNADLVGTAFEQMDQQETVFGLAQAGGYYLIGMRKCYSQVLRKVAWGTKQVWEQTLERLDKNKITYAMLTKLRNLNEADDLPLWSIGQKQSAQEKYGRISVIIPVLNDAVSLWSTLQAIDPALVHEVIVVDGGSRDTTCQIAEEWGAKVLDTTAGRGHQMHLGAQKATGDILLFLNGDTLLPKGFVITVRELLDRTGTVAGVFTFALKQKKTPARFLEKTVKLRSHFLGDQGMFLKREGYFQVGGFAQIPLMEDYDMVCRLKKSGRVDCTLAQAVTSGRRWEKRGWLKGSVINQLLQLGFRCGIPPEILARWYYGERKGDSFSSSIS